MKLFVSHIEKGDGDIGFNLTNFKYGYNKKRNFVISFECHEHKYPQVEAGGMQNFRYSEDKLPFWAKLIRIFEANKRYTNYIELSLEPETHEEDDSVEKFSVLHLEYKTCILFSSYEDYDIEDSVKEFDFEAQVKELFEQKEEAP